MSSPFDPSGIQAVILTGGASRRMGTDKALLEVSGIPLALRTARKLDELGIPVTVLGRTPLEGFDFIADQVDYQGPLVALSAFTPSRPWVFVVSCDMPRFEASIVQELAGLHASADIEALVPTIEGRVQPFLGLYRAGAFVKIPSCLNSGRRSMMAWLDMLNVFAVSLDEVGIDSRRYLNANTPDDLATILSDDPHLA